MSTINLFGILETWYCHIKTTLYNIGKDRKYTKSKHILYSISYSKVPYFKLYRKASPPNRGLARGKTF